MTKFQEIMHAGNFRLGEDRVWIPENTIDFAYNDGDEAELYLLNVMKNVTDKRCNSAELATKMIDWPSTYHLTSRRANLLRPFTRYFSGKRVLEIGCGCGAITRFLGESGAEVVSVEGSLRRAIIARERCSDLPNVEIICSPSDKLPNLEEFDYVLLIGVLEYARMFLGESGQDNLIDFCKGKLKSDGSIFIAIENKLGIKYFAGAAEDHVGQPMFGINNSYDKQGVMTFGRNELKEILERAGLSNISEYLPLPDYKLPTDIVTPLGWKKYSKELTQIAVESAHKDPQGISEPVFSLDQAIKSVWLNNLAPDLSNSFLFIASFTSEKKDFTGNTALFHYSDGRLPQFNKTIEINEEQGELVVTTKPLERIDDLSDGEKNHTFHHELDNTVAFYSGQSLWCELNSILNIPGWSITTIVEWVSRWVKYIVDDAELKQDIDKDTILPGKYNDAMPFNILVDDEGSIKIIDLEWVANDNINLGYVVFRGVMHSLLRVTSVSPSKSGNNLNLTHVVRGILLESGLKITDNDIDKYWERELIFMEQTQLGSPSNMRSGFDNAIIKTRLPIVEYAQEAIQLSKDVLALKDEIDLLNHVMFVKEAEKEFAVNTKFDQYDSKINELNDSNSTLAEQIAAYKHELQVKQKQIAEISKVIKIHEQEKVLSQEQAAAALAQVEALENSLNGTSEQVRLLSNQISNLVNTNSWKLTKPLRFAMRLIRGQHAVALAPFKIKTRAFLKTAYYKSPPNIRSKLLNTAFKFRPSWFLHHPEYQRRHGMGITDSDIAQDLVDLTLLPTLYRETPGRIALHCHIYYFDLIEEFVHHISQVPYNLDVFVSVTSKEGRDVCKIALSELKNIGKLVVDIVPNRGRDIGPMFAHFGNQLKAYDFIGHIQSKKSLYNAGATQGWREYLFNALLGSTQNVEKIFSQFISNPKLGIIYPQAYVQVPYAAFSWLANRVDGQMLCNKMKIAMPDAYFNFPAGSMFWARTDALRPLLDLNLGWNDFPEELAQNDGTLAHAIERLLGAVPTALSYDSLIIKDHGSPSWSTFRLDQQYFGRSFDSYRYLINDAETHLVAFDIFDTLLIRPLLNPDHTKKVVTELLTTHEAKLFTQYRAIAESEARTEAGRDIDLQIIYEKFSLLSGLSLSRCEEIASIEANVELASVTLRPDALNLWGMVKESGKKVILISDMFLPESLIVDMLHKNGILGWDNFYLSSSIGMRKDTGNLYRFVFEKENIAGKNVLMIGDNERSDLQLPADNFGVRCLHLLRANDVAKSLPYYQKLVADPKITRSINEELTLSLIVQKNLNKVADVDPDDLRIYSERPYHLGYNLVGPLLVSFSDWLIEKAKSSSIEQLYFLAREGKIIKEVFDLWSETYTEKPESRYLQLSRRAVNVPKIKTMVDIREIAKIDFFPNEIESFLFERFGLTLEDNLRQEIYQKGLWTSDQKIHIQNHDLSKIEPLLEFLMPVILDSSKVELVGVQKYLSEVGILENNASAIVDVGYSGTIQKALISLMDRPVNGLYMATSDLIQKGLHPLASAKGCFVSDSVPNFMGSRIFNKSFALEQLLSANDAQIAKFLIENDGTISKVFKPLRDEEKSTRSIRDNLQEGVRDYVKDACKIKKEFYPMFKPSLYVADKLYSGFVDSGKDKQNTVLQNLVLDDDYCGRGLVS